MSNDKNRELKFSESAAYWMLFTITSVLCASVALLVYFYYLERFTNFTELPAPSPEYGVYEYKGACENVQEGESEIPIAENNRDGSGVTGNNKECQESDKAAIVFNEFVKNKRDLNAQEGMWRSANYLVLLTAAQVIVGALTLGFLAWTLITQRNELKEARNVTRAQRAFVGISGKVDWKILNSDNFALTFCIKNYGQTPALKYKPYVGYFVRIDERESNPVIELLSYKSGSGLIQPDDWATAAIRVEYPNLNQLFAQNKLSIVIAFKLEYEDVFGEVGEYGDFAIEFMPSFISDSKDGRGPRVETDYCFVEVCTEYRGRQHEAKYKAE